MRAAAFLLAVVSLACGAASLARHSALVHDGELRLEIAEALDALDELRDGGLLGPGRLEACAPPAARDLDAAAFGHEPAVPSPCERALRWLARVEELRRRAETLPDDGALDALDTAMAEIRPVPGGCPSRGDDLLALAAAVVRHRGAWSALDLERVGVSGATARCDVATIAGPIEIGPPEEHERCRISARVLRGELLPDLPRVEITVPHPPDAPADGTTSYSFEDDLLWAPDDGPFAGAPFAIVEMPCAGDTLWLGWRDGRWHVVDEVHGER